MDELRESLDNPIFFLFVVAVGVAAVWTIVRWGAKAGNLPGLAHMFGG